MKQKPEQQIVPVFCLPNKKDPIQGLKRGLLIQRILSRGYFYLVILFNACNYAFLGDVI